MRGIKPVIVLIGSIISVHVCAVEFSDQTRNFIRYDAPAIAIEHATVIDGSGEDAQINRTVLIAGGKIELLGEDGRIDIPGDAVHIDATGKTLLPGFIMVHEHFIYPAMNLGYNHQGHSFPPLYLAGGATTIRTGGGTIEDKRIKEQIDSGQIPGPKIVLTGPHINSSDLPIWRMSNTPEEAARVVRIFAEDGFPWAKAYMHLDRAQLRAVLEEAKKNGTRVTGHLCKVTYAEAAEMGIDNLEHGFLASTDFIPDREPDSCDSNAGIRALIQLQPDGPEIQKLFRTLIEHHVAVTSTNTVFETFTPGRPGAGREALSKVEPGSRDYYYQHWSDIAHNQENSFWDEAFPYNMNLEYRFAKAGGLLVVGTDPTGYGGVIAGYSNQRALELLVESGFTVPEAVQVATLNGARLLGIENEVGTIEAGKTADLILVNGDLVKSVSDIHNTELVFKDGIAYDSKALFDSIGATVGLH